MGLSFQKLIVKLLYLENNKNLTRLKLRKKTSDLHTIYIKKLSNL